MHSHNCLRSNTGAVMETETDAIFLINIPNACPICPTIVTITLLYIEWLQ